MFIKEVKTFKLTFMGPSTWRKIFLIKYNDIHQKKEKIIFDRSSTVPHMFANNQIRIYAGFKLRSRSVSRWMVGFKFGEFTWNRKVALYKAKQLRKKKKKK
jgi:ribosomal protein S19